MVVRYVIDPLDFVRNSGLHHGSIPINALVRLHESLFDTEGEIIYCVKGQFDQKKRPGLELKINGNIHLNCQRCLDKLFHSVDIINFLFLAKNNNDLNQVDDDDSIDAILITPELDIISLIEDEIILSLPISPRHPDNECSLYKPASNDTVSENVQAPHPFTILKTLKNN